MNAYAVSGILLFALTVAVAFNDGENNRSSVSTFFNPIASISVVILGFLIATHRWPGFHNPVLIDFIDDVTTSHPLFLNLDKALVGYVLLAYIWQKPEVAVNWRRTTVYSLVVLLLALCVLIPAAILLGIKSWQVSIPSWLPIWAATNLLVSCIAEEAFFRGFIQKKMQDALSRRQITNSALMALLLTSLLFGIAHIGQGILLALLAAVAAAFYGYVYQQTGRLASSISVHFLLNLVVLVTTV